MAKLKSRLTKLETAAPGCQDAQSMSDAQLIAIVRKGVRELEALPARTAAEQEELEYLKAVLVDDGSDPGQPVTPLP